MPFSRILVVIDGEPEGQHALEQAIGLATALGAKLDAVVVEGHVPRYAATVGEVEEDKRQKDAFFGMVARLAQAEAADAGLELDVELTAGNPTDAVNRVAAERGHDLIVVGYHHHLFGGTAERLCRRAPCAVLVVRRVEG